MQAREPGAPIASEQEVRGALPAGYRVQQYEIAAVLGQGGFGITYRARDTKLKRDVAIKEYLPVALALRDGGRLWGALVLFRADRTGPFDDVDVGTASLSEPGGRHTQTFSAGYTHHLSKRTDLYAYALWLRNNAVATRGLWYFGTAIVPAGQSSNVAGVGIRHAF